MLLVDAGADSCCNFFSVKEDDFTYDTVRMYIKHKIVNMGKAGQHQTALSSSRFSTLISTRHILS